MVNVGDDVTMNGKVAFVKDGYVEVEMPSHETVWIKESDIKAHRPQMKGEEK